MELLALLFIGNSQPMIPADCDKIGSQSSYKPLSNRNERQVMLFVVWLLRAVHEY